MSARRSGAARAERQSSATRGWETGIPALRSRNVLRAAMEALPVAVLVLDGHQRVRYANAAARALGPRPISIGDIHGMDFATWAGRIGADAGAEILRALAKSLDDPRTDPARVMEDGPVRMAPLRPSAEAAGCVIAIWPVAASGDPAAPDNAAVADSLQQARVGLEQALEAIEAIETLPRAAAERGPVGGDELHRSPRRSTKPADLAGPGQTPA